MALKLRESVFEILREHREQPLSARQIAEKILQFHPEACADKLARSSFLNNQSELLQQIVAEIAASRPRLQKIHPQIKTLETRPRKFYYSEASATEEIARAESAPASATKTPPPSKKPSEAQLYPLLGEYLYAELSLLSKRIDEKRSSNNKGPNGNRWLYPDIVALENLTASWSTEIRACASQYADQRTRLWSFEVKCRLNRSNSRECFFQALSNSSWANLGYLVAAEIEGSDTLKELRLLSAAHGIGLMLLDAENPAESQILIPARERAAIDWDIASRLAVENKDFLAYIKSIRHFYQTGDLRHSDWQATGDE
ncbi:COG2958 family protein [Microbulbifer sp. TRSA001]|uniref:COG2958 family protein n=1 Tax=Microbulbifer sp. TRSA001 TaxID=3243381 RepID=UPI00403A1061